MSDHRIYKTSTEAKDVAAWLMAIATKSEFDGSVIKFGSEGVNTAGGFLAPEPLARAIAELRDKVGVARAVMEVVPMSSDVMRVAKRDSGTTAYFVDENSQVTESQAGFGQITLTAKKLATLVRASSELTEDADAFASYIAAELAFNLESKIDETAFNGDGSSTFKGIRGLRNELTSGLAGYVLATSGNDTWAEFTIADMTSAVAALPSRFHGSARWLCHPVAWGLTMCRLSSAAGGPLEMNGQPAFMGYPVTLSSAMQGGTAATDLSNLVSFGFGDVGKAGMLGDRRNGVRIGQTQGRYLEFDQIGLKATARFDVVWHGLGDTASAGAVVGLVGN